VARNIKDRIFMGFSWELCCQQDWDRVLKQWWNTERQRSTKASFCAFESVHDGNNDSIVETS